MRYQNTVSIMALLLLALATQPVNAQDKPKGNDAPMSDDKKNQKEVVVIETSMGTIEVAMYRADAPRTVENFTKLAEKGYYNGITFHRVIDKFMIQGGDPTGTGAGGESIYGKKFEDEISPKYKFDRPGILAMANSGAGTGTNGSQFFITTVPTPWLNGNHTIFGEVVSGMDIVNAIGKVETKKPYDKPVKDVVMKKVYVKGAAKSEGAKKAEDHKDHKH